MDSSYSYLQNPLLNFKIGQAVLFLNAFSNGTSDGTSTDTWIYTPRVLIIV